MIYLSYLYMVLTVLVLKEHKSGSNVYIILSFRPLVTC